MVDSFPYSFSCSLSCARACCFPSPIPLVPCFSYHISTSASPLVAPCILLVATLSIDEDKDELFVVDPPVLPRFASFQDSSASSRRCSRLCALATISFLSFVPTSCPFSVPMRMMRVQSRSARAGLVGQFWRARRHRRWIWIVRRSLRSVERS